MNKSIYIWFVFLLISINSLCQIKSEAKTNVDLNYLKPKWMDTDLKVKTFRNGVAIEQANSIDEWNNLSKNSNPSLLYIHKTSQEDIYLYSWFAANDPNQLAPVGYKIPSVIDLKAIQASESNLKFSSTVTHQIIEQDQMKSIIDLTGNEQKDIYSYFWLYDEVNNEFGKQIHISADNYISQTAGPKRTALIVRCIQDLEYLIINSDSTYSYKELMPQAYLTLLDTLGSNLINSISLKDTKSFKVDLDGNILFNKNGENISNGIKIATTNSNIRHNNKLQTNLNQIINQWGDIPYYHDLAIKSSSPIQYSLIYKKHTSKFDWNGNPYYIKNYYSLPSGLIDSLQLASNNSFRSQYLEIQKVPNARDTIKTTSIKSFAGKGPIYSLLSFAPGLGMTSINPKSQNKSKVKLWHFSIPIGLITAASLVYSNYFYNKYKSSNDFKQSDYDKANISHKVFLTSSSIFAILAMVDFGITFKIGTKNKILQRNINQRLKKSYPNGLVLN